MKTISVVPLTLIGEGVTASVYILDDRRIIKVFRDVVPMEEIQYEHDCAKLVGDFGISTPAVGDIVKTDQGTGLIYERVKGNTLSDEMQRNKDKLYEYGVQYGELVKSIHEKEVPDGKLIRDKTMIKGWFDHCGGFITDAEKQELLFRIDSVPSGNNLLHGDIAPVNIMVGDGHLYVIDLPTIMAGNPVFDLLQPYTFCQETRKLIEIYRSMSAEEKKGPVGSFLSRFEARYLDQEQSDLVWNGFLKGYFGQEPGEWEAQVEYILHFYNSVKFMGSVVMRKKFGDEVTDFMVNYGRTWLREHKNEMENMDFSLFAKEKKS